MVYELYTWVNCDFCDKTKEFLSERGIPYREFSLFNNPEGSKALGKIYAQLDGKLKRKTNTNGIVLPLLVDLVEDNGKKTVKRFAQYYDSIDDIAAIAEL